MKLRHQKSQATNAPRRKITKMLKGMSLSKKLVREGISDKDFLPGLFWRAWQLAMVPNIKDCTDKWVPRQEGRGGRNSTLFKNTDQEALYEFKVQVPDSKELHPMLYRNTVGFINRMWDTYLLNNLPTSCQVDRVICRGYKVYAHWTPFTRPVACRDTKVSPL